MMSIEKALKKYMNIAESDNFSRYEKEFAQKITSALSMGYQDKSDEPCLVEIIKNIIDGCSNLTTSSNSSQPYFELSTNATFIHGYPSQSGVEFDYYGKTVKRELGDIIFIASVVFNGQIYFQKYTINQFKKDKQGKKSISWDIDKEQLYLLSRFPTFKGVQG